MQNGLTDEFLTAEEPSQGYFMEKGSKFMAYLYPVTNETEAQGFIQALKKSHPKARHFCSALRLGPGSEIERSNDDGEPGGSAGKPILGQLVRNQLTNVLVVVVRYFGGTKLGIPGLIEAYKISAAEAVSNARIIQRSIYTVFGFNMNYEVFPLFKNHIIRSGQPVFDESFNDQKAFISFGIKRSGDVQALIRLLKEFSQRDFENLEDYVKYLNMELIPGTEEKVL